MTFISFEGIDGCGKTTQTELLRARFESLGRRVLMTREPGGTALAEALRAHLLDAGANVEQRAELLLFGAARAQHVGELIRPALERGEVVLCDRFTDSSMAYQGGAMGLDAAFIRRMNDFATQGLKPDVTFLLDLDAAQAMARRQAKHGANAPHDRIEGRGLGFQQRVRAAYVEEARQSPQRIVVLDALAPAKVVHARIVAVLQERNLFEGGTRGCPLGRTEGGM